MGKLLPSLQWNAVLVHWKKWEIDRFRLQAWLETMKHHYQSDMGIDQVPWEQSEANFPCIDLQGAEVNMDGFLPSIFGMIVTGFEVFLWWFWNVQFQKTLEYEIFDWHSLGVSKDLKGRGHWLCSFEILIHYTRGICNLDNPLYYRCLTLYSHGWIASCMIHE